MQFGFRPVVGCLIALGTIIGFSQNGRAQDRIVEITITPTERAQLAIWIETADGEYLRAIRLTEAVALRGIGNRPGATQMNSGFHWPYGRREGVLPVWAHRRLTAEGAEPFKLVIFQDRASEGFASRTSNDPSPDDYFCLSFNQSTTTQEALDAVTCASQFHSDKGRYITASDVAGGYAEPFEDEGGTATMMRPLDLHSLYPARRDLAEQRGQDHPDVVLFTNDTRNAMPEIDAVTMATLAGGMSRSIPFIVPTNWPDGQYKIFIEVNVEGDYNTSWGPERFPTPLLGDRWDVWAKTYGYPYRGQPSVVYELPIEISGAGATAQAMEPIGYGSIHGESGDLEPMDGTISMDADTGGGRLLIDATTGARAFVEVVPTNICGQPDAPPSCFEECLRDSDCGDDLICSVGECMGICDQPIAPEAPGSLTAEPNEEKSWHHVDVSFDAPISARERRPYEVRFAMTPLDDPSMFDSWGTEAKQAILDDAALIPCTDGITTNCVPYDTQEGERIEFTIGRLLPQTRYYVGVRAVAECQASGPVAVAEVTTTEIIFTTVSPCFVATAAYGDPLADDISTLRRFRDRHLRNNPIGRTFVGLYEQVGPWAADFIRDRPTVRSMARAVLEPLVELAQVLDR